MEKKTQKSLIIISSLVIAVLLVFLIVSHFVVPRHAFRNKNFIAKARFVSAVLGKMLDLKENQKAKLNKITSEIITKVKNIRGKRKHIRKTIINQFKNDKVDIKKVSEVIKAFINNRVEDVDFFVQKFAEFHSMLTKEQRLKLMKKIKKMSGKRFRFHR